jgi:hypothetical protein
MARDDTQDQKRGEGNAASHHRFTGLGS